MKKHVAVTLMSTMLLGMSSGVAMEMVPVHADTVQTEQDAVVAIPDDNLRKELQNKLGAGVPITKANLLTIEALNLTYSNITDLTGLGEAKNLKYLDLTGNAISNLDDLGKIQKLGFLSLRFNKAEVLPDLAPLANTAITQLNLVGNDYGLVPQKLAAVENMTTLENLELQNNKLTQAPNFKKLTNLHMLGLAGNKLTDVSGLKDMTSLTELEINSNQIVDFEPVSHLTALERLSVGNNRSSDVSSLKSLTKLKKANFSQMGLSNSQMAIFSGMKDLETLAIDFNDQISDLSNLSQLDHLTDLDFSKNSVASLAPLSGLKNLKNLGFSNNNVSDISALKGMTQLATVNMMRNHIADVSPLKDLTQLERVNAKFQSISLPDMVLNKQNELELVPAVVTGASGNAVPLSLQSAGQLTTLPGGVKITGLDATKENTAYMSWEPDTTDKLVKFSGTIAQPFHPQGTDKTDDNVPVKIAVLKGDGSELTSVASNFIQADAFVENQSEDKKSLLIKVIVPKSYGENSISFATGTKVSSKLVGESYILEYRFDLDADALQGKPFKQNMHVKINPEVMNYDHRYDVFFKINGLNTNTEKDDTKSDGNGTDKNVSEKPGDKQDPSKKDDQSTDQKQPNVLPSKKQEMVTYKANYLKKGSSATSTMAQFMTTDAQMYYVDGNQYVVISAKDMTSANMIQSMTLNGKNYFKRDGNKFYFNLGQQKLQNNGAVTFDGFVGVSTNIPGLGEFKENQPFTLRLDGRQAPKSDEKTQPGGKQDSSKKNDKPTDQKKPNVLPSKKQETVTYKAHYLKKGSSATSTMAQFMTTAAQMYYADGDQYVVISAKDVKSANMIQSMTLNGKNYFKRDDNKFYFNLGKQKLQNNGAITFDGFVGVSTNIPGLGEFKENQPFTLRLDGRQAPKMVEKAQPTGKSDTTPKAEKPTQQGSSATKGRVTKTKQAASKTAYHNYTAQFLKQGTNQSSVMASYMLQGAHVEIQGNQAMITIFANNASSANMITRLTLGGQTAVRSGNGYTVTLPKSMLNRIIAGHVDVDVPGIIKESQPFSLRLTAGDNAILNAGNNQAMTNAVDGVNATQTQMMPLVATTSLSGDRVTGTPTTEVTNKNQSTDTDEKQANKTKNKSDKDTKAPITTANTNMTREDKPAVDNTLLWIGGVIATVLGFIGTILGWKIFKG